MSSDGVSRATVCNNLESKLRTLAEVQEMTSGRQPPAFAMLTVLFEVPGNRLPRNAFSESVTTSTTDLCERSRAGDPSKGI